MPPLLPPLALVILATRQHKMSEGLEPRAIERPAHAFRFRLAVCPNLTLTAHFSALQLETRRGGVSYRRSIVEIAITY